MNTIDFVKMSLEMSQGWIMGLVEDMKDAPLTSPTAAGGNHPLWCVGHLAYSEGSLVSMITGNPNQAEDWKGIFGEGTSPTEDASRYPSMEESIARLTEMRAATMALLDTLSDEDLDKPTNVPEEMKDFFGTVSQCLAAIPIHFAFHGGQIADARRAAGRAPLMG